MEKTCQVNVTRGRASTFLHTRISSAPGNAHQCGHAARAGCSIYTVTCHATLSHSDRFLILCLLYVISVDSAIVDLHQRPMPIPIAAALPAAAAGLAYLDAKHSISYDLWTFKNIFKAARVLKREESTGRYNSFFILEERALDKKTSDKTFLIFEDQSYTFRDVYYKALRYGSWIKNKFSIKPGDVVALDWTNTPTFIWVWYGINMIGAKPCFINHNLTGVSLVHCVKVGTAKALIVDPDVQHNLTQDVLKELEEAKVKVFVLEDQTIQTEVERTPPLREPDSARMGQGPNDLAVLIFTSGTTGLPKAAWVSWAKASRAAAYSAETLSMTPNDRFFTVLPLYHSAGSMICIQTSLMVGCTAVLGRKFSPRKYWAQVREAEVTVIQYVGELCRYMLTAPPDPLDGQNKVRLAHGNGLRPDIWQKFKERYNIPVIVEFYAATESPAAMYNVSRGDFSAGAVGRGGTLLRTLFAGASATVKVDNETEAPWRDPKTGFCVRVDRSKSEAGEVLSKLPEDNIKDAFQGYYNNDKASNSKIERDVFKKGDAYFRTGDLLRSTPDGLTYFQDRIGDTFRWKSENVSTNEVGDVVSSHPAISEANVYGVELPNHDGRAGCAAVVLEKGKTLNQELLNSLAESALKALPRYAVPVFVRVTDKLETTGTSKYMKHILRGEGVNLDKVHEKGDKLFWLQGKKYVEFKKRDFDSLDSGAVKL